MDCPTCGFKNAAGALVCENCAHPLPAVQETATAAASPTSSEEVAAAADISAVTAIDVPAQTVATPTDGTSPGADTTTEAGDFPAVWTDAGAQRQRRPAFAWALLAGTLWGVVLAFTTMAGSGLETRLSGWAGGKAHDTQTFLATTVGAKEAHVVIGALSYFPLTIAYATIMGLIISFVAALIAAARSGRVSTGVRTALGAAIVANALYLAFRWWQPASLGADLGQATDPTSSAALVGLGVVAKVGPLALIAGWIAGLSGSGLAALTSGSPVVAPNWQRAATAGSGLSGVGRPRQARMRSSNSLATPMSALSGMNTMSARHRRSLNNPMNPNSPLNPMNPANPNSPLNPMNRRNPASPLNPMNPANPNSPLNPMNPMNPNSPLNPMNRMRHQPPAHRPPTPAHRPPAAIHRPPTPIHRPPVHRPPVHRPPTPHRPHR